MIEIKNQTELIQKLRDFADYATQWFNENIASGLAGFLKAVGNLLIRILEFLIDIIKWLISW